jgi:hypothetical protein
VKRSQGRPRAKYLAAVRRENRQEVDGESPLQRSDPHWPRVTRGREGYRRGIERRKQCGPGCRCRRGMQKAIGTGHREDLGHPASDASFTRVSTAEWRPVGSVGPRSLASKCSRLLTFPVTVPRQPKAARDSSCDAVNLTRWSSKGRPYSAGGRRCRR